VSTADPQQCLAEAQSSTAHAAFRASAWSVGLAGGHGGGRIWLREGVGAAQCIGRPVPAGHVAHEVRCVGCGHPGGGDEQRACRGSARGRHRVGGVWNRDLATPVTGMPNPASG
jgi:hypothetical protein